MAGTVQEKHARLRELDGLRGLAALGVVLFHWASAWPAFDFDTRHVPGHTAWNLLKYTPLHILVPGQTAVIVFFTLSGFVLALPFAEGRAPALGSYLVRRALRLYPAAWAAAAFALVLVAILGTSGVPGPPGSFIARAWHATPGASTLLGHATLLPGGSAVMDYDPPLWSLVQELRVSLIFPALVVLVLRARPGAGTVAAAALCVAVSLLHPGLAPLTSFAETAEILVAFAAGIELAKRRRRLTAWAGSLRPAAWWLLLAAAIVLMTLQVIVSGRSTRAMEDGGLIVLLPTAAACIFIALALSARGRRALTARAPAFLGRISYSLYLLHVPVLLALLKVAGGHVPRALLAVTGIAAALALADLAQRYVEAPAIALGRRLTAARPGMSASAQMPDAAVSPATTAIAPP